MDPQTQEAASAVLFADVSGSTKLYESAGDAIAVVAIDNCIKVFTRCTHDSGGRVIKTIGDEVMSVFNTATDAAGAAIDMQNGIDDMAPVGGTKLGIRVGFHFGQLVEKEGDVFGDTVNLAARLAGLATRGQIITSRETVDKLTPMLRGSCRELYSIQVKGKVQEVKLCEVLWQTSEEATTMASLRTMPKAEKKIEMVLSYSGTQIAVGSDRPVVTLGRDPASDLAVRERMASRSHGKVELRRDKFMLVDHSANGTYVQPEGGQEILLRREELTLSGRGKIAFGQSCAVSQEIVTYECDR